MVVPVIALGVYELLAAGAAATGLGAFAVAKRHELAEGVSDAADAAQDVFRETTLQALPYIIGAAIGVRPQGLWRYDVNDIVLRDPTPVPGLDLDLDAIRPWSPPIVHIEEASPVVRPRPIPVPLERIDGGRTGLPTPPNGPEDPLSGLRRIAEGAKKISGQVKAGAESVAKNRWVQGAATLYRWYIYGSTALFSAEIGRRMALGSEEHGPILYDWGYKRIFGESAAARAFLGGHQVMAAETTSGMIAIEFARHLVGKRFAGKLGEQFVKKFLEQLLGFKSVHAYALLGNLTFFEDQMAANDLSTQHVDVDRASRTALFYGGTSIAFYPLVGVVSNVPRIVVGKRVLDGVGRIGFRDWLGRYVGPNKVINLRPTLLHYGNQALANFWQGVGRYLGPRWMAVVAPHYVPRFQTLVLYAGFATVYRNVAQIIASHPWLEDSDWSESMKMANVRNALSIVLTDPYFYLGAKGNSMRAVFGNQLIFMGFIFALNQYYSRFDGKDIAVAQADRRLKAAFVQSDDSLQKVVMDKPLTQRNFWGPPETDLSAKTWAELTRQYANREVLNPKLVATLIKTMRFHLKSHESGERRVGMALGVMLSQIALTPRDASQEFSGWRAGLKASLEEDGVRMNPRHAGRPLDAQELNVVFDDINAGHYDEAPLFQFPRN